MIALITGASSGIGKDIAKELAKRKYNLIIVARNEEKLKETREEIKKEYSVNIDTKTVDLSDRNACEKLYENVKKEYGNIDVLINNAGFGDCGNFTETDLEKELKMIDTNISAYHILTKLFLQDMERENSGYIMNVASIAGFMPGPLMSTYYSTKAYVVRLTQGIQRELKMKKSKVRISVLCPGPTKTNFQKVADVKFNMSEAKSSDIARIGIKKMFKNKKIIFTEFHISLARILAKILPDSFMGFCCYFIQKRKII